MRPLPLLATLLLLAGPAGEARAAGRGIAARPAASTTSTKSMTDMIALPAGSYRPLYGLPDDAPTAVAAFRLDRDPVTRGDWLAFVRANPQWRRSAVRPLFADRSAYLADWRGDLQPAQPGDAAGLRRPVTGISWFAARAYCAWRGKRLPTVHEWEYAAAASATRRDAAREPGFIQSVLELYTRRPRPLPTVAEFGPARTANVYGLRGLHGLAWEWTSDFNSVLVSDDSRGVGGRDHDLFCASAAIGATDPGNYPAFLRYAVRASVTGRSATESLGARCAA
ncbi:MAG: formylglycine-generating enzyme family protein [Gemmatirosa sp.]